MEDSSPDGYTTSEETGVLGDAQIYSIVFSTHGQNAQVSLAGILYHVLFSALCLLAG